MRIFALCLSLMACLAATISATTMTETTTASKHGLNYIVMLNPTTDISDFIPRLVEGAVEFFHKLIKDVSEDFEDLIGRTNDDDGSKQLHVKRTFDIGGTFKALDVELMDDRLLEKLTTGAFSEIVSVIPDEEIQFDLARPAQVAKVDKRYYIRPVQVPDAQPVYANSEPNSRRTRPRRMTSSSVITGGWSSSASDAYPGWSSSESPYVPTATKSSPLAAGPTEAALEYLEQEDAPWNLVRVSERDLDADQPYIYDARGGHGVTVYVVDDGIAIHNTEFEGRAKRGWSALTEGDGSSGKGNETTTLASSATKKKHVDPLDGGGHGTHVAGLIGGKTYGVAKNVTLVSVQVLNANGKGTVSSLLGGIQWIMEQEKNRTHPALINMSLGLSKKGDGAKALAQVINAAVDAGLPVIAAAGNSASDACDVTPAGNDQVYTVGSTDRDDAMDPYSCYGKCVNMLAPGFDIKSAYIGKKGATATMSGSSMAAPHVSGVAALLLPDLRDPSPKALYKALDKIATRGKVTDLPDKKTPNKLLFNGQHKTEKR